jgi:hypothetical protein
MSRKIISTCLMVSLFSITSAQWASGADVRQPNGTALLKEKVELFGVGANVKVKRADGQKLKRPISSIVDAGFTLAPKSGGLGRPVNYDQGSELTLVAQDENQPALPLQSGRNDPLLRKMPARTFVEALQVCYARNPSICQRVKRNSPKVLRRPRCMQSSGHSCRVSSGLANAQTSVSLASRRIFPSRRMRSECAAPRSRSLSCATFMGSSYRKYGMPVGS